MRSYSSEPESSISISFPNPNPTKKEKKTQQQRRGEENSEEEETIRFEDAWPRKNKGSGGVMLEGYVDASDSGDQGSDGGGGVGRTKSLTDDDLEELKGCLDLGFEFSYEEIPELCNTLPALELCYSMSQRFLDEQQQQQRSPDLAGEGSETLGTASPSQPIANWKISSPGDHPEEVKARLKYWAQAVACTVRLCS